MKINSQIVSNKQTEITKLHDEIETLKHEKHMSNIHPN